MAEGIGSGMTDLTELLSRAAAIVGKIGAGKTYVAKGVVEELLAQGRRVVIIDPTGVWYGLRAGADGSHEGGFPVMIFGGEHADVPITDQGGKAVALAIADRQVQCIIDLSEMTNGEKIRFMTPFLEHLYAKNRAALHLIVDEADEIAAQRLADGEQRMFGAFDKIVRRGRVKGFRPLMISQRPAVIHKNVLSQIGTLIALQLTSPQDRKAIDEWVKGNADTEKAKEVMSTLMTLPRGEGWVWAPSDDVLERMTFRSIRTFDSSRTPEPGEALVAPALTSVDVEELRAAMGESRQDHEADVKVAYRTDPKEIDVAEKRGLDRGYSLGMAEGKRDGWLECMAIVRSALGDALDRIGLPTGDAGSSSGRTAEFDSANAGSNPAPATSRVDRRSPPPGADGAMSPSARKVVDAVKAAYPMGVSLKAAGKRAGLSVRSSAYRSHLAQAAASPEIEQRQDGKYIARQEFLPEGPILLVGIEGFKSKLPPSYANMLSAIEAAGGGPISKEDIAVRAGVSPTSSGLGSGLRELIELDLIVKRGDGYALSPDFL